MWLGVGWIGLFLVLALVFFMGHGGCLIAGYNTASPEEKARYDFRKLSRHMGIFSLGMACALGICFLTEATWTIGVPLILALVGFVLLGNYWCLAKRTKPGAGFVVGMVMYLVFVGVLSVFLYSGEVTFYMDEDGIILDASFTKQAAFYMEDIESVALTDDFHVGFKKAGVNNAKVEAGRYHNQTLGDYWLYARTQAKHYLIFETTRGTYVYGDNDVVSMQKYVTEIQEAIAS